MINSKKTLAAYHWIETHEWESPKMKYRQDRLLYWYHPDSESWLLDEEYLKIYQEYKKELIQLKYYESYQEEWVKIQDELMFRERQLKDLTNNKK